eukprot:TRINITY_DN87512_c0_g1_i1.p1 TRINITY_DN87512_c0_g1~~TRINITY_DN87512_c0_g1_i1.p1  ORF type:complete len:590 (+),score=66.00 TRINITY_DN87512_c0_g1_i1:128-1897(+)
MHAVGDDAEDDDAITDYFWFPAWLDIVHQGGVATCCGLRSLDRTRGLGTPPEVTAKPFPLLPCSSLSLVRKQCTSMQSEEQRHNSVSMSVPVSVLNQVRRHHGDTELFDASLGQEDCVTSQKQRHKSAAMSMPASVINQLCRKHVGAGPSEPRTTWIPELPAQLGQEDRGEKSIIPSAEEATDNTPIWQQEEPVTSSRRDEEDLDHCEDAWVPWRSEVSTQQSSTYADSFAMHSDEGCKILLNGVMASEAVTGTICSGCTPESARRVVAGESAKDDLPSPAPVCHASPRPEDANLNCAEPKVKGLQRGVMCGLCAWLRTMSLRARRGHAQACDVTAVAIGPKFSLYKDFSLGETVGLGSFGRVLTARHSASGQIVAVKEMMFDSEAGHRALGEITLCEQLDHPRIVRYLGHEVVQGMPGKQGRLLLILGYCSGGSLESHLQTYGPLDIHLVAKYAKQLLEGLSYLHGQLPPVVHRDLKGANLLLTHDANLKISDFGCSKLLSFRDGLSGEHTVAGSLFWMAPEVLRGRFRLTPAVDIWSLGCCVLEMATAKKPWAERNFDNIICASRVIGSRMSFRLCRCIFLQKLRTY